MELLDSSMLTKRRDVKPCIETRHQIWRPHNDARPAPAPLSANKQPAERQPLPGGVRHHHAVCKSSPARRIGGIGSSWLPSPGFFLHGKCEYLEYREFYDKCHRTTRRPTR